MNAATLFLLVCLVPGSLVFLVWRYGTGFLGLSLLNLAMVGSASLAAFFFGTAAGLDMGWFTEAHADVVLYSVAGCLAMAAGLFMAWRPLRRRGAEGRAGMQVVNLFPGWMNPAFGWACSIIGIAATLAIAVLGSIPTLSTALYGLENLSRFGIFVLLVTAMRSGRWGHLLIALVLLFPVLLVGALRSGHTPLSVALLLPVAFIVAFHRRVSVGSFMAIGLTCACYLALMSAWMNTRTLIRSGEMSQMSLMEQAQVFLPEFVNHLGMAQLQTEQIQSTLLERVDMSDLLAQQRLHQPENEPFAYGQTFLGAFTALVPRALWSAKPVFAGGSEFVNRFTGMSRLEDDTTSIGLPYQFELYANGGPWWVVVGLFLIGCVSGRAELKLFQEYSSLGRLLALAVTAMIVCDGGQRADVTIPSLIAGALSAYVAGWALQSFSPGLVARLLGHNRNTTNPSPSLWTRRRHIRPGTHGTAPEKSNSAAEMPGSPPT